MNKKVRIGLFSCVLVLGLFAVGLSFSIWQTSPFYDLNLVVVDVMVILLMAILFAVALMAPQK